MIYSQNYNRPNPYRCRRFGICIPHLRSQERTVGPFRIRNVANCTLTRFIPSKYVIDLPKFHILDCSCNEAAFRIIFDNQVPFSCKLRSICHKFLYFVCKFVICQFVHCCIVFNVDFAFGVVGKTGLIRNDVKAAEFQILLEFL